MDCLLVENPIKGDSDGFALQIPKMQQAKPCILIFQRKRMQGFVIYKYHIDSYCKSPHNTSKKLLRKEQIQLVIVHARHVLL